jgi:3-oxoacyl-[acyl-carrier protein] reductase
MRNGGIDVLCANAGIYPEKPLQEISEDDLDSMLAANLKSAFFSVQACLAPLAASNNGRIILTSSITGPITGYLGSTHYGASKAGQLGFMRSAALELADKGITVNAIVPGLIFTERHLNVKEEVITALSETIPARRLGSVEDIGYAALFLASNEAGFITGQTLVVDGGHTIRETI